MGKGRLEAFSDGVIAIIITIMVLELHVPESTDIGSLLAVLPQFSIYLLSFIFVGIYWMNHHHLLQSAKQINGKILWANLSLLFWLSLFPFVAGWMGENLFTTLPSVAYGFVLFMAGVSYLVLQNLIISVDGKESELGKAIGNDRKGIGTAVLILVGIVFSFIWTPVSLAIYVVIALIWFIPDIRIEKAIKSTKDTN